MSPLVSVVIPTFNREHVLREAIESALAQRHRDLEIIVIDDGSSDATQDLVARVYGDDARVLYRYQTNAGVAAARNAGLRIARGEYIAFLDSDDVWKPWHVELLVACLDRIPEAGMVWTDMDAVDATGTIIWTSGLTRLLSAYRYFSREDLFSRSFPLRDLGIDLPPGAGDRRAYVGDIFSQMVMGNLILTSTVLMRRDRVERMSQFDEGMSSGEDYEFFLRACRAGPVAFADIADVRYRIGTGDRLSGPAVGPAMARGYLDVLEATLDRDADRITLSPVLIDKARAHAHRWLGAALLQAGSTSVARRHLVHSIRIRPRQPGAMALLILTFVPRNVFQAAVDRRRQIRRWFGSFV